jgi:hypothetical protein
MLARWSGVPRAVRWSILAAAGFAAYFAGIDPLLDRAQTWDATTDRIVDRLASRAKDAARDKAAEDAVTLGRKRFGEVKPPGDNAEERARELDDALRSALRGGEAKDESISSRESAAPSGLTKEFAGGRKFVLLVRDIRFRATPEGVAQIIGQVERSPLVTNIASLSISQSSGEDKVNRLLQVSMNVESLALAKAEGGK